MYKAVLGEFLKRGRAVKADPGWQAARELPRRTKDERKARGAVFRSVQAEHGFEVGAAQSFASSLHSRGCVSTCPRRRPRIWGRGRSTRSASGIWAGEVSRGSSP